MVELAGGGSAKNEATPSNSEMENQINVKFMAHVTQFLLQNEYFCEFCLVCGWGRG